MICNFWARPKRARFRFIVIFDVQGLAHFCLTKPSFPFPPWRIHTLISTLHQHRLRLILTHSIITHRRHSQTHNNNKHTTRATSLIKASKYQQLQKTLCLCRNAMGSQKAQLRGTMIRKLYRCRTMWKRKDRNILQK